MFVSSIASSDSREVDPSGVGPQMPALFTKMYSRVPVKVSNIAAMDFADRKSACSNRDWPEISFATDRAAASFWW